MFRRRQQRGSSLIEVMVGALLLAVGMLAVTSLVNAANRQSASTQSADGATALAREVLERVREVPFDAVAPDSLEARLRALPGLAGVDTGAWRVRRAGVVHSVSVTSCAIDSPDDGVGVRTPERFCEVTGTVTPPGGGPPQTVSGIYADLGLLDTQVTAALTGSLLDVVCTLAGPFGLHLKLLPTSALLNAGADVILCPSGSQVAADRDAEDLKRVTVVVTPPEGREVRQSALIPNPDRLVAAG